MTEASQSKIGKFISTVDALISAGKLDQDYKQSKQYKQGMFQAAIDDGMIEIKDDGSGFKVRSIASFADSDEGYEDALIDHYGEGNIGHYVKDGEKRYVYLDENKNWNHVDSEDLEWADIADGIGLTPEMIGGALGGIAGFSMGGGLGSVPAAAGGTALGRMGKKGIASMLGIDNAQNGAEKLEDLGESAIGGGIGEGIGQLGGKVLGKASRPFANRYGTEQQRLEEVAREAGIKLTPADTMGSNMLTRLENFLGYGLTGQKIADFKEAQFKDLKDYLLSNVGNKTGGMTTKEAGEIIQNKTADRVSQVKQSFNDRYNALADKAGTIEMPMWKAQKAAQEMLDEINMLPDAFVDGSVKSKIASIANLGKKMDDPAPTPDPTLTQRLTGARPKQPDAEPEIPTMTYPQYKATRSEMNDLSRSSVAGGDAKAGRFKYVRKAMDKDFDESMANIGMAGEKRSIDQDYGAFKEGINRPEIKNVIGTDKKPAIDAEKVVDTMVAPRATTRLENAIQYSGAEPELSKGHLANMIDRATVTTKNGDEYVSAAKLGSYQKKYGDVHKQLTDPQTQKVLDNYVELDRAVGASTPERINPSGTAKALEGVIDLGIIYGTGAYGAMLPAAKYAASKYYMTPTGYRHLTKGLLDDKQVKGLQKTLGGFGVSGSPIIYSGE